MPVLINGGAPPAAGELVVVVPETLLELFHLIQEVNKGREWIAYLRGRWEGTRFVLDDTCLIPRQKATATTVEADPEDTLRAIREGYNAVVHSHHELGLEEFSDVDKEHLLHYEASLLYASGRIVAAMVKLWRSDGVVISVPARVVVQGVVQGYERDGRAAPAGCSR